MPSITGSNETGSCSKRCAQGVMPWARQAKVRTLTHRHFEPSTCRLLPRLSKRLIHDKDAPSRFSRIWNAKYSGADMTHETTKALLMIMMIGGLLGALHIPKIWASQQWAFLVRAMAQVRSAIVLTDRALWPAFIKHKSHKRQLLH